MIRTPTEEQAWDMSSLDLAKTLRILLNMADSVVVRHGLSVLRRLPPDASSIEIGSGLGKLSLLLAMGGACPTLLDRSAVTLDQAQALFAALHVPMQVEVGDALALPSSWEGRYDMSLSLGVNEHFQGGERQAIFDVHARVLKPGGWTVIGVPNRYCLSYRIAMLVWRWTGRWPKGLYERGFSRQELLQRMRTAGFEEVQVFSGSDPGVDAQRFILSNLQSAVNKVLRRPRTKTPGEHTQVTEDAIRAAVAHADTVPPEPRVLHQAYMWVAIGQRPGVKTMTPAA